MWKIVAIIAVLGFAQISAQEFCVQCQSSATNFDCVYDDRLTPFIVGCENNNGSCFTRTTPEGFIERGCGAQLNGTECVGERCTVCQLIGGVSTPCNNLILPAERLTCYQCDGDANSTCANLNSTATDGEELRTVTCPVFRSDDQCFSTRAGDRVTRGCLSNAPTGRCDNGVCGLCTGNGCNHLEWSELNSAFLTTASSSLLISAFAVVTLMKLLGN